MHAVDDVTNMDVVPKLVLEAVRSFGSTLSAPHVSLLSSHPWSQPPGITMLG